VQQVIFKDIWTAVDESLSTIPHAAVTLAASAERLKCQAMDARSGDDQGVAVLAGPLIGARRPILGVK